jgi:hypothetical protein
VVVTGRRAAGRTQVLACWLPGLDGRLAPRRTRDEPTTVGVDGEGLEAMAWAG